MGIIDCNTLATLNLMFGTLQYDLGFNIGGERCDGEDNGANDYLSFVAVTITGNNLEHVMSEPITGARSEMA